VYLGDWEGPIFGRLGFLERDGDRVCCHACGGWYIQLGIHAYRAHGLKAAIYKVIFGLNVTTGLAGEGYRERVRVQAEQVLAPYWPQAQQTLAAMTPEQWQAVDRSKRLEARLDPDNRAAWAKGARRGGARIQELAAAGLYQAPLVRQPELARRQSQRMRERAAADPEYRARLVRAAEQRRTLGAGYRRAGLRRVRGALRGVGVGGARGRAHHLLGGVLAGAEGTGVS
jgi:hypothetical protein